MARFILSRILYMIPTLFGMSLISFAIIQLPPGDYLTSVVATMTDSGQTIDPAQLELLKTIYGFDQPIYVQYASGSGASSRVGTSAIPSSGSSPWQA